MFSTFFNESFGVLWILWLFDDNPFVFLEMMLQRTTRMAAAVDAMKPCGFTEDVVKAKMKELLKVFNLSSVSFTIIFKFEPLLLTFNFWGVLQDFFWLLSYIYLWVYTKCCWSLLLELTKESNNGWVWVWMMVF